MSKLELRFNIFFSISRASACFSFFSIFLNQIRVGWPETCLAVSDEIETNLELLRDLTGKLGIKDNKYSLHIVSTYFCSQNWWQRPRKGSRIKNKYSVAMKILLSKQQTRKIAIVSETHGLVFRPINSKNSRRSTCAVELVPKAELNGNGFRRLSNHEVYGFIGLIEIEGLMFIATITGKSKVAQPIPNKTVNKIYAVDFLLK